MSRYTIFFTPQRFELREDERVVRAADWTDVIRIVAFKKNLFTLDRVCLEISYQDGARSQMHEGMAGWRAFAEGLPEHLPGCAAFTTWYDGVAFPAFQRNAKQIFERASETPYR